MRGAPQVGFSATIRKIRSRTSLESGLRPTGPVALETNFQYSRNPALCQRTTVSGVTKISECFQPDQRRRAITQKSRSKFPRPGRGLRRFSTVNCWEETLSRAKKANQRPDAEFHKAKHGGQL